MSSSFTLEIKDLSLKNTFENGQCFRWRPQDGGYTGVVDGRVLHILQEGSRFTFWGADEAYFKSVLVPYFDLERDYGLFGEIAEGDELLENALRYGKGMRILRQDAWEVLISFVISQNNHIARIRKLIEKICAACGTPITEQDQTFYAFPTSEQLVELTPARLREMGCGYRGEYIFQAARRVAAGEAVLAEIARRPYPQAKAALSAFTGIGPKVADCILLFGMGFVQAFPIDTWIRKVMQGKYLCRTAGEKEMQACAAEKFGSCAGILQQYLFYYARDHKIKGFIIDSETGLE